MIPSAGSGAVKRGEVWLHRPMRPPKIPNPIDGKIRPEEVAQEKQQPVDHQMLHVSTRQLDKGKIVRKLCEVLAVEEIEGRDGDFVRVGTWIPPILGSGTTHYSESGLI